MSEAPVVLVTGAARGIGAAVVRRMVARGCHVVALDACLGDQGDTPYVQAGKADLDTLRAEAPDSIDVVVADVRSAESVRMAVDSATEQLGRVDSVVACAAVIEGGAALWETDPALAERLWATDAMGVWHTAHAAVPHLLAGRRPASFVAISSAAGSHGLWHLAAYCMVKHAVEGLVRGLAADLRETAVSVSAVAPGSTDTAMLRATADLYGLSDVSELVGAQLIGRVLDPDEVAAVAEFAAFAGPAVHGSVLSADGGFIG
jgi:SDR family mycofactocin-dependent oxidoreductase